MKDDSAIRILIADEHAMCREAIRNVLERETEFQVIGEVSDGENALRMIIEMRPDIALLDLVLQRYSAIELLRRLQESGTATPVLILAESVEAPKIVEALRLGAKGFLLKESAPEVLYKSIRIVSSGEYWIGRGMVGDLVHALRNGGYANGSDLRPAPFSLTRRELEIIAEVAEGCTNKNIAEKLSIAEQTVKHHLTSIFQKVGVNNRLELAVFAMHRGIHGNP